MGKCIRLSFWSNCGINCEPENFVDLDCLVILFLVFITFFFKSDKTIGAYNFSESPAPVCLERVTQWRMCFMGRRGGCDYVEDRKNDLEYLVNRVATRSRISRRSRFSMDDLRIIRNRDEFRVVYLQHMDRLPNN